MSQYETYIETPENEKRSAGLANLLWKLFGVWRETLRCLFLSSKDELEKTEVWLELLEEVASRA
jgi:hypothetical protein